MELWASHNITILSCSCVSSYLILSLFTLHPSAVYSVCAWSRWYIEECAAICEPVSHYNIAILARFYVSIHLNLLLLAKHPSAILCVIQEFACEPVSPHNMAMLARFRLFLSTSSYHFSCCLFWLCVIMVLFRGTPRKIRIFLDLITIFYCFCVSIHLNLLFLAIHPSAVCSVCVSP